MKKSIVVFSLLMSVFCLSACEGFPDKETTREAKEVNNQQAQYAKAQPPPKFDWSWERRLMIELYKLRNKKIATYSVWRSDYGIIEGDCPSMGYGLPYDVSLTNPLVATDEDQYGSRNNTLTSVEQPEPNGIYASKNTSATWVMCIGESGGVEPVYVESKVTIYPGPVKVDYKNNRVVRSGAATVLIPKK